MILGSTAIATWIAKLAFIALLLIPLALGLISLGWYVAVIVLLYRIWPRCGICLGEIQGWTRRSCVG